MIRTLLSIVLVACALPAAASSTRLEALAEDGLLLEDPWSDHLWPGSLAGRDNRASCRASDGLGSGSRGGYAFDITFARRPGYAEPTGRIVRVDHSVRDLEIEWAGFQAGVAAGSFAFGAAVLHDYETNVRETGMRFGLGVRWTPRPGLVLDLAHELGRTRSDDDDLGTDALRARIHKELSPSAVFVAVAARDPWATERIVSGYNRSSEDLAIRYEAGFLLWPDADTQLLVVWVRDDVSVDFEDWLGEDLWAETLRGDGIRMSFEIRPSAWWSWRLGLETLGCEHTRTDGPDDSTTLQTRMSRLGAGLSLHLGEWDLDTAFSRSNHAGSDRLYTARSAYSDHLHFGLSRYF